MSLDRPLPVVAQEPVLDSVTQFAARHPDHPALWQSGQTISYGQLVANVVRLADALQHEGLRPGERVGLDMPRGPGAVTALLAIWRSRATVLCLDPALPALRRSLLIAQTGAAWVIRASSLEARLAGTAFVFVDAISGRLLAVDKPSVACNVAVPATSATAYVVFTSGTTARPKGVLGTHAGLSHFLKFQRQLFEVGPADRVLQTATLAADGALKEIGLSLVSGATLLFAPTDHAIRGDPFGRQSVDRPATVVQTMPSLLENWLSLPGQDSLAELRVLSLAGEPLMGQLVQRFRRRYQDFRGKVFNFYGQTETSVSKTFYAVPDPAPAGVQPLGQPLPDTEVYILDEDNRPMGALEVGQIAVRTPYRSLGYLEDPGATAAVFLPNPARIDPDDLLYLSGDLGRFSATGQLHFVGRCDEEVKITGVRVHPGEPEGVLSGHRDIAAARVIAVEVDGAWRLVGFYQPRPERLDDVAGLERECRRYLEERLPSPMVPSTMVAVPHWPLTASGKADRAALLALWQERQHQRRLVPPRTATEQAVAEIWGVVLNQPISSVTDNFFELGGNSLSVVSILFRLRERFLVNVQLHDFFQQPTIADLAALIDRAGPQSAALADGKMERADRSRLFPLTDVQKRLWIVNRLLGDNAAYNMPVAIRLRGHLPVQPLQAALDRLVQRHEMLRTRFFEHDDQPFQGIDEAMHVLVEHHDLTGLPVEQREPEAQRLMDADALNPFDLTAPRASWRLWLLRLSGDHHVLYFNAHHILADGLSIGVLLHDLFRFWSPVPPEQGEGLPKVDFFDHAMRQPTASEVDLAFWKQQLGGELPVLELPHDGQRLPVPTLAGDALPVRMPEGLAKAVRRLAAEHRATPFMVLLAAFAVLARRLTGQGDLLIGSDDAGRDDPRFERTVGMFVRTLVLRIDAHGPVTFEELIRRTRDTVLQAKIHGQLDFYAIVQTINPDRDLSRTPLFQVMFRMFTEAADVDEVPLPGVLSWYLPLRHATAKFDLTLTLREGGGLDGLVGELEYSVELFARERMLLFIEQYRHLLEGAVANPRRDVAEFSLDPVTVPRVEFAADHQPDVGTLVARVAGERPGAVAIGCGPGVVRYRELLERADALAQAILGQGLQPGDAVALASDKSPGFVVGVLGILRGGMVVVPLDADLPPRRKQLLVSDSRSRLLVEVDGTEPVSSSLPRVRLSRMGQMSDASRSSISLPPIGPWHAATLFYTSGTTGQPKGILGNHGSLSEFIRWEARQFQVGPADRVAQITSLSFDAVLRDLFTPLCHGGSLWLPEPGTLDDIGRALAYLRDQRITVLHTTPSVLDAWLHAGDGLPLPELRLVALAGEPLAAALVNRARQQLLPASCQLVNFYGPSETLMIKSFEVVSDPPLAGIQPIGRAIDGAELVILNERDVVCTPGELGEIHLGHCYLCPAYLTPGTESAFRVDPRTSAQGQLLYRTGDLGRWLPDGRATIAGRRDDQVKIRGQRVDPAETTAVLSMHPGIEQAVVLPRTTAGGEQLIAFYTTRNGRPLGFDQLAEHLHQYLPPAMVPALFHHVPALPVMSNGKVNRQRLLESLVQPEGTQAECTAAMTVTEQRIHEVWRQYLKRPAIGPDDNFFRLGGHSLLATIVLTRIRVALGLDIPLRALFRHPTIRSLARHIDESIRSRVENMSEEQLLRLLNEGKL
jgi:amino acid adenylation domain-containing protein